MKIEFDIQAIRAMDLAPIVPRLFVTGPRDHRERDRVYEKHESQYRMLQWLSWQFNGLNILDVGTRAGTSAFCLADNPANKVTAVDITHMYKNTDIRPFLYNAGIDYLELPAQDIPTLILKDADIISLDISHNGLDELHFLDRLEFIGYEGIVIMDDINFPRRFKMLNEVWTKITRPKLLLPRKIAHDTGTGIVIFGDHEITVTEAEV